MKKYVSPSVEVINLAAAQNIASGGSVGGSGGAQDGSQGRT